MSEINLGMGVMIGMLSDNSETVNAIKSSLGKTIKAAAASDKKLQIGFTDDTVLTLWDDGQSCCESRYMVCDDKLDSFTGAKLVSIGIKEGPKGESQYGDRHEIQFLEVSTDRGVIQCATHNEHNGYYGGFFIRAALG